MLYGWILLMLAIVFELSGTVSMKYSAGFSKLWPSVLMFLFYGASFTLLNFALQYISVSVAYAVWSGIGIVLITVAGFFLFGQPLPWKAVIWIGVIVIGVVGLNMSVNQKGEGGSMHGSGTDGTNRTMGASEQAGAFEAVAAGKTAGQLSGDYRHPRHG